MRKNIFITLAIILTPTVALGGVSSQALGVRIYTDPSELAGPCDRYTVSDTNSLFPLQYIIVGSNSGNTEASSCTLIVQLPDHYILPIHDEPPILPPGVYPAEHTDNTYIFSIPRIPSGESFSISILANIDVTSLPDPTPSGTNCITLRAGTCLYNHTEFESFTDNTTFCKDTLPTFIPNLWVSKSESSYGCDETGTISYTIHFGNNGETPVENILLSENLGGNIGITSISSSYPIIDSTGGSIIWEIPALIPDQVDSIVLSTTIHSHLLPDSFFDVATITSDSLERTYSDNHAFLTTICGVDSNCYDLSIRQEISGTHGARLSTMDTVTLIIHIFNKGDIPAYDVEIIQKFLERSIIDGETSHTFHTDSILPGEEKIFLVREPTKATCQEFDQLTSKTEVFPTTDDCDSTDNISISQIAYLCPEECPYPAKSSTRIITPNSDGYNDYVTFTPNLNTLVKIFDMEGNLIATIRNDEPWDGRDKEGKLVLPGIYIWQMFCPSDARTPFFTATIGVRY